jgi:hypothetical protein
MFSAQPRNGGANYFSPIFQLSTLDLDNLLHLLSFPVILHIICVLDMRMRQGPCRICPSDEIATSC